MSNEIHTESKLRKNQPYVLQHIGETEVGVVVYFQTDDLLQWRKGEIGYFYIVGSHCNLNMLFPEYHNLFRYIEHVSRDLFETVLS